MGKEIEHKYLVRSDAYKQLATPVYYRQGYIPTTNGMTVRLRIAGNQGYLTMKDHARNLERHEWEYPIPAADAQQMLELMSQGPQIEKQRYVIEGVKAWMPDGSPLPPLHWEVDVFGGDNEGLVVAEIEVPCVEACYEIPDWIGTEVTGDHRYYNSSLTKYPYKDWR